MKIVIDSKIPFMAGVFEPYAETVYREGARIDSADVRDADALIVRTRTRCDAGLLEGSMVRMIATATIGYDHIDLDYCASQGIEVVTAAGCNAGGVAQWVAAVLTRVSEPGKTLGIVGVGNVGKRVLRIARELGFRVVCNDPLRTERGEAGFITLDELLSVSDVVTLHVPLDRAGKYRTENMADRRFFSKMKQGAVFLNSSRGETVDEKALSEVLKSGKIEAALDVWRNEPAIDRVLLEKAVLTTPHVAGYSLQGKANGSSIVVRAVAARFGLSPLTDWFPGRIAAPGAYIYAGWDDFKRTMHQYYDIATESSALKERPELFEDQRNRYCYRNEFF